MTAYASRAPVDAERASEYKQQRSSSHDSAGPWGHAHFGAAHSRSAIDSGAMQCIHMIVVLRPVGDGCIAGTVPVGFTSLKTPS
jgi:hypothetical protein